MDQTEARRQALLKLGGIESTKEAIREQHALPFVETLLQDVRFTLRQLIKTPGFTFTAILMLALGIGASVSIFGFVDAALLKPLPYREPNRLVHATGSNAMFARGYLSYPDYLDWKRQNRVFSSFDVFIGTGFMLRSGLRTDMVRGVRVSDGFFRTLGVVPILGRDFYTGEDLAGAPHTAILSYGTWRNRFGGKGDVIGQTVLLSGVPYTIVGVLPENFSFAPRAGGEIWSTLHAAGSCDLRRSCHGLDGIARLKDGVSVEMAAAEMKSIAKELEEKYPGSNRDIGARVMPLAEDIIGDIRPILLVLLSGAGLLLLIASVNVASLLLLRSEGRKRELAVRNALGASRVRIVRQFVTEGLVLVSAGTTLGLVLASWGMQLLTALIPQDMLASMPYLEGLRFNVRILGFAGVVSLLAAILFSIVPALHISFSELREGLNEGTRGSAGNAWRRLGSNLVVVELAVAVVLLVGAGLLTQSFQRLLHVRLGFEPDHLATVIVAAPDISYAKDGQIVALAREIIRQVEALPGVKAVGITSVLPLRGNGNTDWIRFVGRPFHGEHNEVNQREVTSEYFRTLQAKLLRGRHIADADDATKPKVVVINQTLANQYFPGEDPIGKKIGNGDLSPDSIKEIVGVVDDIKEGSLESEMWPAVYYPFYQGPDTDFSLVARTSQDEKSVLQTIDAVIRKIDPNIGTVGETTMVDRINRSPAAYLQRSSAWLVGGFAALALLLGVVGLYGVIAYSVSQRTREIGVRMALGAQRGSVYRMILEEAGRLTTVGIAVGFVCSLASGTVLRKLLFGIRSWDLPTLFGVGVTLLFAALLATYLPARRAASVDPVDALRAE
jgi:predicted permease